MIRCNGHQRHWFTVYGKPGVRTDRCVRCGKPKAEIDFPPGARVALLPTHPWRGYRAEVIEWVSLENGTRPCKLRILDPKDMKPTNVTCFAEAHHLKRLKDSN